MKLKRHLATAFIFVLTAANLWLAPLTVWACSCTSTGGATCTGQCCFTFGTQCSCYDEDSPACSES